MIDREELERLHREATNGPWDIDSEYDEDGLYSGGGGCGRGFKNFFVGAEINSEWRTLLDTQNSDNKLIEEEYDEDGVNAWDATGMANAELITYLRNAVPDILKMLDERDKFMWQVRDTCTRAEKAEAERDTLAAENTRLEEANRIITAECTKWAREAGEAKGKLEGSEAAGIIDGWREKCRRLEAENSALTAKVERLEEALTPSGETKFAYMGEFSWTEWLPDESGTEQGHERSVPWTTIKEIMMAIGERAIVKGEE